MAVSLLRRMFEQRGLPWNVASAGVIGYDDDPADSYASIAMSSVFGLTLHGHQARSLQADMVADATIILAIDSSIMNVLRGQYADAAERMVTLGTLAGRPRDVPDPYRMDMSAWITYAQEIDQLLRAGLERLIEMVYQRSGNTPEPLDGPPAIGEAQHPPPQEPPSSIPDTPPPPPTSTDGATATPAPPMEAAPVPAPAPADDDQSVPAIVERCERLLRVVLDMPALISWDNVRQQLDTELRAIEPRSGASESLLLIYVNLLHTLLAMNRSMPTAEQLARLHQAIARMQGPIDQTALSELSTILSAWDQYIR